MSEPFYRNRAFLGAWRRGRLAAKQGLPERSPYSDARTYRGAVTFSRAFERAWLAGYRAAAKPAGNQEG